MSLLKKTITIATLVSMLPGTVMANGSKNRRNRRKNVPGVVVKIASGEWAGSVGEIEKIEDSVMINGLGAYYMKGTDADKKRL